MKFKLILIILLLLAIVMLAYFSYPIVKSRYFVNKPKTIKIDQSNQSENAENNNQNSIGSEATLESSSLKITVSPTDCDNGCSKFEKDTELEYCKQACGISAASQTAKEIPANCEEKNGLQKDYCLKDLGIANKDFKICDQIQDDGIKKTCQNRITEDIIESQ
jgi:cytoskeletal protein RodZ